MIGWAELPTACAGVEEPTLSALACTYSACARRSCMQVNELDKGTPDEWVRRHPDMIRLTSKWVGQGELRSGRPPTDSAQPLLLRADRLRGLVPTQPAFRASV